MNPSILLRVLSVSLVVVACAVKLRRSARLLQAYELDFWQAASDPPGSPLPVAANARPRRIR
jgi:hypothetical protein